MKRIVVPVVVGAFSLLLVACPDPMTPEPEPETQVAAPQFTPDPSDGPFSSVVDVTMSTTTSGAAIYYEYIDANPDPTEASTLYDGPVTIPLTQTYRVRAYKDGLDPSELVTATFQITPRSLPFSDDFEDGDAAGWSLTGGSIDSTVGAALSSKSVLLSGADDMLELDLRGASPTSVVVYMRSSSATSSGGEMRLFNMSLLVTGFQSTGIHLDYTDYSAYSADTFYKLEFNLTYPDNLEFLIDDASQVSGYSLVDSEFDKLRFVGSPDADIWIDQVVVQ